jgi:VWFA-related protein
LTASLHSRIAAAGFVLLLLPLPSFGQAPPRPAEAPLEDPAFFGETFEVRRINVEVYVVDGEGKRVTDLKAQDFQVFEDGKPVEITNFLAVAGGKPLESSSVMDMPAPEAEPEPEPVLPAEEEIPEERRQWVVLYVDNLHIRPFNRNKVLGHVRSFVRSLPRGAQAMLVSFDKSLHVRESFTTDFEMLTERTFELENLSAFVVEKQNARDNTLKQIKGTTKDIVAAGMEADFYAKNAYHDVEQSIRGLDETIELLAGLPGRKSLVYISDGLEMRAGEDMFQLVQSQYSSKADRTIFNLSSSRYDSRRLFQNLAGRSNSSGVTLYTIDAAGLKAGGGQADTGGGGSTFEVDVTYQLNRQEPLLLMADETGGLAAIGTSNFGRAFQNIAEDFTHYYSLAYEPRQSGDGRQHEIEVKVLRKGLKLRYRDGYRDKSSETRVAEAATAALLYGSGTNPFGIDAKTYDLVQSDAGALMPVEVRIPIGKVTMVERNGTYYGKVRVAMALLDDDGNKSPVDQKEVPIEVPAAEIELARTKFFVYAAQLKVGKGRQRMVVTVRDEFAGIESTVRKTLVFSR